MKRINPIEIIKRLKENDLNVSKTARDLGINRKTVRKWRNRSRSQYTMNLTTRNLKRKSTAPLKPFRKLTVIEEIKLVDLRRQYKIDQLKIACIYEKKYGIKVSGKTVYNILKRRSPELIRKSPNYQRPRFQNGKCMRPSNTKTTGYLQVDTKYVTPELSGLEITTYEFAFIDIYSRYKVGWIIPNNDQESAITALRYMIKVMPCKVKYIQTDNGWEYGKGFHQECKRKGIKHYYIHKSSPNENAVIERSFRTDQDEFYYQIEERPKDINELNKQFQKYLIYYNEVRPHMGLELKTPIEMVNLQGGYKVVTD
jgi:transposase InsO family protein